MVDIKVPTRELNAFSQEREKVILTQNFADMRVRMNSGNSESKLSCISWSEPENILKSD